MVRKYKAISEHLSCELEGEVVILNVKNGRYYGFNEVGSLIWSTIQNSISFGEIQSVVMQNYNVDEKTCLEEIEFFLDKITKADLIEITDEEVC
jgi:hypothetical protein